MILVADVKAAVAHHYGVSVEALEGKCRRAEFVHPRQVAMALSRRLIKGYAKPGAGGDGIPLTKIGERFGHRHHTTVMSAIRAADKRRKSDPETRRAFRRITLDLLREGGRI